MQLSFFDDGVDGITGRGIVFLEIECFYKRDTFVTVTWSGVVQ